MEFSQIEEASLASLPTAIYVAERQPEPGDEDSGLPNPEDQGPSSEQNDRQELVRHSATEWNKDTNISDGPQSDNGEPGAGSSYHIYMVPY